MFFFSEYIDKTMGNLIIFSTDKNTRPDTVLSLNGGRVPLLPVRKIFQDFTSYRLIHRIKD